MLERLLFLCDKYPLDFISHLSSSLPAFAGILRFRYLSLPLKIITFLFFFYFVKETVALWFTLLEQNNLYIQNIDAIISIPLVGFIYYYCFEKAADKKIIIVLLLVCVLAAALAYKSMAVSSISISIFRAFSIALSLAYFNKILVDMQVKSITRHSMFWFTAGLLIFSAGTFFSMLFSEYWYQGTDKIAPEVFDKYWNAGLILFIFFCLASTYGLWVSKYDQENLI